MSLIYKLRKANKFAHHTIINGMSTNPNDYPNGSIDSLRIKMQTVASSSNYQVDGVRTGGWYAAQCQNYGSGDPTTVVGRYFLVFCPRNADGTAYTSGDKPAAAPCPPFCGDDEGPF